MDRIVLQLIDHHGTLEYVHPDAGRIGKVSKWFNESGDNTRPFTAYYGVLTIGVYGTLTGALDAIGAWHTLVVEGVYRVEDTPDALQEPVDHRPGAPNDLPF